MFIVNTFIIVVLTVARDVYNSDFKKSQNLLFSQELVSFPGKHYFEINFKIIMNKLSLPLKLTNYTEL